MFRGSLTQNWGTLTAKILAAFIILYLLVSITPSYADKDKLRLIDGVNTPYPAPLLMGISAWINSSPIKLSDLSGKVVLIEFWTSSCPFCRNALPYVNKWYKNYHNKGLLIIGVHSPKNEEEQSLPLVKDAVAEHRIHYPVALDNNFETWSNYKAEGWPSFYLIDKKGYVVYVSYGAQNYDIIENNIQYLLNYSKV